MGESSIKNQITPEFIEALLDSGHIISELRDYLHKHDSGNGLKWWKNGDGKLTGDEYVRAVEGLAKIGGMEGFKLSDEIRKSVKEMGDDVPTIEETIEDFKSLDKNNDGILTLREWGITPQEIFQALEENGINR